MRRWIFVLLGAACLVGLGLICFPVPQHIDTYQTRSPAWTMRINRPGFLRAREGSRLSLEVHPPESLAVSIQSVRTRLELEGLLEGSQEAGETIQPGGSAYFSWGLQSDVPGKFAGRLWVYAGEPPELLNVRPVEIEVIGPPLVLLWMLRIGLLAGLFAVVWFAMCSKHTLRTRSQRNLSVS